MWKTVSNTILFLASSCIFALSASDQDLQLPPCNSAYNDVASVEPFVVGGNKTYPTEFPFIVNIMVMTESGEKFHCAGSLINWKTILTAAHCLVKYGTTEPLAVENVTVVAGDFDISCVDGTEQISSVGDILIHPDYNWDTHVNDIALIILAKKFNSTEAVQRIPLPLYDLAENSTTAVVAGWGYTENYSHLSNVLIKAEVPIVKNFKMCNVTNKKLQFCAGGNGTDACTGDSGGPLMCSHNQSVFICGIVSHGQDPICGNVPGVYMNVYGYTKWIQENDNLKPSKNTGLIILGFFGFLTIAVSVIIVVFYHHWKQGYLNNDTLLNRSP